MRRATVILVALLSLAFAASASAHRAPVRCVVPKLSGVTLKVAHRRLARAHCRAGKVHRPKIASGALLVSGQRPKAGAHRKHGATVTLWLKAKPVKLTASTTPSATTSTPTQSPVVRAKIDPSYTQDSTNPLMVTWSYDAGVDDGTLPDGILSLTVYEHGHVASAGGCTIDVGGPITGGDCTLILPQYGEFDVTVSYASSSASVAPSTSTDTETIEPPAVTHTYTWGTDAPTQGVYIQTLMIGDEAHVTVGDPNFEGAQSVDLTDSTGAQCTATVAGITATCTMTDIATPTGYTVSYPGGTMTTTTVSTDHNGQQQVTDQWPATVVQINDPQVTIQQAVLVECGGQAPSASWGNAGNFGCTNSTSPKSWPLSLTVPAGPSGNDAVFLDAWAYGSLADDQNPAGTVNYTVTPGVLGTDYVIDNTMCGPQCGFEEINFLTPGTYTVSTSFTSADGNYDDQSNGPSITITAVS